MLGIVGDGWNVDVRFMFLILVAVGLVLLTLFVVLHGVDLLLYVCL